MSSSTVLIIAAVVASLFLVGARKARAYAIGAAAVAGVALTMSTGFVSIRLSFIDLALAAALAVLGVLLLMRVEAKMHVVASTVVTAVGVMWLARLLLH
ncbi:MAG TPA: hypothetical protein VIL20_06115 [Sandaracinaceae bacterium]